MRLGYSCRNDREVYIQAKSDLTISTTSDGDWYQPKVEIQVYGLKRSATFCNWFSYKTDLWYQNVLYALYGWSVVNNVAVSTLYSIQLEDLATVVESVNLVTIRNIGSRL